MIAYPPDFNNWSIEKRNEFFTAEAAAVRHRQAALADEPEKLRPSEGPLPVEDMLATSAPFPTRALGKILAGAAERIAEKIQCTQALAAQSVLAVASLAAQGIADVHLPHGQTRPLSLYLLTIAESGDRKTSADNEALLPVRTHERAMREAARKTAVKHEIELAAWTAERRKIERERDVDLQRRTQLLTELGPSPSGPLLPILICAEPTVEGLAKIWPRAPGSLGLFASEGGQLTGGHGFGPDYKLRTSAALSVLWDGGGIRRLRAGDGLTDLPGRRLAVHLMVQPEVAKSFLGDPVLRDQGLLSRVLLAAPRSLAGNREWRESAGDEAIEFYSIRIRDILAGSAVNARGNDLTPRTLELSAEARAVWIEFYNSIERETGDAGAFESLRDVAGKAAEQAARIAGVLTIVSDPASGIIEVEALADACELVEWYLNEAQRLSDQILQSRDAQNAARLLKWLHAKDCESIGLRTVLQLGPSPLRVKRAAEGAIAELIDLGWLVPIEGRPKRWKVVSEPRQ